MTCDLRQTLDLHPAAVRANDEAVARRNLVEASLVEVDEHVLRGQERLVLSDDDALGAGGVSRPDDRAVSDAREDVQRLVRSRDRVRQAHTGLDLIAGPAEGAHADADVVGNASDSDRDGGHAAGADLVGVGAHRGARHVADDGGDEQLVLVDARAFAHSFRHSRRFADAARTSPNCSAGPDMIVATPVPCPGMAP